MKLSRKVPLYWRFLISYLLIIVVGCLTFYVVGESFAPIFFRHHMGGMMSRFGTMMTPMMSAMTEDLNDAYGTATRQAMAWGIGTAAIVAGAVSFFVTAQIASPLKEMQRASSRIAAGQYGERLDPKAPGEIGELARDFNLMAEALETSERRRVELLSNVAHEFKTPLSSLHGYLEGLEDGLFQPNGETLGACKRQVVRLERLIADLSLLSWIETGQERLTPEHIPARELLEQVITDFRPQFSEKGVALLLEELPARLAVQADAERTGQVLGNLLANALRHTPPGGKVQLSAQDYNRHEALFQVSDDGEGIATDELAHIFTRFYRADKARQHQEEAGSGIGLTLAKHYVENQGGRIGVESEVGCGSRFWFTLPKA